MQLSVSHVRALGSTYVESQALQLPRRQQAFELTNCSSISGKERLILAYSCMSLF
jgi:hypothetical protein